jgi:hypothetical protein
MVFDTWPGEAKAVELARCHRFSPRVGLRRLSGKYVAKRDLSYGGKHVIRIPHNPSTMPADKEMYGFGCIVQPCIQHLADKEFRCFTMRGDLAYHAHDPSFGVNPPTVVPPTMILTMGDFCKQQRVSMRAALDIPAIHPAYIDYFVRIDVIAGGVDKFYVNEVEWSLGTCMYEDAQNNAAATVAKQLVSAFQSCVDTSMKAIKLGARVGESRNTLHALI